MTWEWIKSRVYEFSEVSRIIRELAPVQLAAVPGENKELDGIPQSVHTT